jgi:hypothetical protein
MRTLRFLILAAALLAGCNKEPDPAKKPPQRYRAETQRNEQNEVTIWSATPEVPVGVAHLKLQFQTLSKQPAIMGKIEVAPVLVKANETPVVGHAEVKATDEAGVYDVIAELPSPGRWRLNVSFDGNQLAFYYTTRRESTSAPK